MDFEKDQFSMNMMGLNAMRNKKFSDEQPDCSDSVVRKSGPMIGSLVYRLDGFARLFELRGMMRAAYYNVMTIERKGLCDLLEAINEMYDELIWDPIKKSMDVE